VFCGWNVGALVILETDVAYNVAYDCLILELGRSGSGLMCIPVMWMWGINMHDLSVHVATWYWSCSYCVFCVTANVSCLMARRTPPRPLDVVVDSPRLSFLNGESGTELCERPILSVLHNSVCV